LFYCFTNDIFNDIYNLTFLQGCYDELLTKTKANFVIVGGTALGIAVFQVCVLVFNSIAFAFTLKKFR